LPPPLPSSHFSTRTFSTQLFERYQRSEKALVLPLMQKARGQGLSTRRVKLEGQADPVRIFPNGKSAWRHARGALCAEKHEEWSTGRRYLSGGPRSTDGKPISASLKPNANRFR
jgi:transposase-like protein